MTKELYTTITREVSLSINDGRVDSLRRKNITKSGCRVYHNGFIGVAGTLGNETPDIWAQAEANLSREIPCPWGPETGKVRTERYGQQMSTEEFLSKTEHLLETLRQDFPQFTFSNKANWTDLEISLRNSEGLNYTWQDAAVQLSILVRAKDSLNIFDTAIEGGLREFDEAHFLAEARRMLEAHLNPIALPDVEKMAILTSPYLFSPAWNETLNGQKLARGASLLADCMGKPMFSPHFSLCIDRTKEQLLSPFFDHEGTTLEGDSINLIDHGVLVRGYADKKCAWEHHVDPTSSGAGNYDDVATLSLQSLAAKPTGKTLDEILDGRPAIYCMPSGGDITPDGSFASPVQTAYLYQNGTLLGRLPEFSIRGKLTEILGSDYLGCSTDRPFDNEHQMVANMTIVK